LVPTTVRLVHRNVVLTGELTCTVTFRYVPSEAPVHCVNAVAGPPSVYAWHSRNAVCAVCADGAALAGPAAANAPAPASNIAAPNAEIFALAILDLLHDRNHFLLTC
jgi:hypothetical protein